MDFATAVDWWFRRVDFEKQPARRDELRLDRMRELLSRLGDPQNQLRIIHVAGSKGKGSTAAMFEAVARASGLRTGLFTSPHLSDVRERVQVNRVPISPDELAVRLTEIRSRIDDMVDSPTFFEIATALAYHHFVAVAADVAIIEVGLGGRFDSTNVCHPILSVVTSISFDHVSILGDKLPLIAREKSGIIKPGVPVISGVSTDDAAEVVESTARKRQSPILQLNQDFQLTYTPGKVGLDGICQKSCIGFQYGTIEINTDVGLLGRHQAANASLVLAAIPFLKAAGINITDEAARSGLTHVDWPARLEILGVNPLVVLDCAHNVASATAVMETLSQSFPSGRKCLVYASSSDKDIPGIFGAMLPEFDVAVFCRYASNQRAASPDFLVSLATNICPDIVCHTLESPLAAYEFARSTGCEIVVITGSLFLAGELRPHLLAKK